MKQYTVQSIQSFDFVHTDPLTHVVPPVLLSKPLSEVPLTKLDNITILYRHTADKRLAERPPPRQVRLERSVARRGGGAFWTAKIQYHSEMASSI